MIKDFIPARESPLFVRLFSGYARWLLKWRFTHVRIHQEYEPGNADRTVYFLNHTSWWDGLIPLLLNESVFHQHARAMMEHRQMKTYPFFKWLGAFSIQLDEPTHIKKSLTYALDSMDRPGGALYIYPEGKIKPVADHIEFKSGIGWLAKRLPGVDFVPIGIHMHTVRHNKPELHLWVGEAAKFQSSSGKEEITKRFQNRMEELLQQLRQTAGFKDKLYHKMI